MSKFPLIGAAFPPGPRPAPERPRMAEDTLVTHLQTRLGEIFTDGRIVTGCAARVLKKRLGSRRVIAYRLAMDGRNTGQPTYVDLIGKRYSQHTQENTAREFQTMRMLWQAGFGEDQRFKIAKPVRHFPDLELVLEEKAEGVELSSYLGNGDEASLRHARMAGLWLAKLHSLPVAPASCVYDADVAALRSFVRELGAAHGSLAPELLGLEAAIRSKIATFRGVPRAMVHGDYHPENILVAPDSITAIDFDRFCLADPARDLGSFIAHVRNRACFSGKSLDAANREIDAFLEGYFSQIPPAKRAAILRRIPPFVTHASLEALYYVACVLKVTNPDLLAIYFRCARESGVVLQEADRTASAPPALPPQVHELRPNPQAERNPAISAAGSRLSPRIADRIPKERAPWLR
jgi:hypothetical protein